MPCPHFNITITQRSKNQSAIAGAAYQSGETLFSEYDQKRKSYSEKRGIVYTEIMLPANAPPEYADRNTLWNAAEKIEKQWNSQLARRIVFALPIEVPSEQYPAMLESFCREHFVSKGMCVDFAIHDKGDGNPHAHIMLTMRAMDENGKWLPKSRKVYDLDENGERIRLPSGNWKSHKENTVDWNEQKYAEVWRHGWEVITNDFLEQNNRPERVDLRSYERQGLDIVPTVHIGPAVTQMERRGEATMIGDLNRDIKAANSIMQSIRQIIRGLQNWIAELMEKRAELLEAEKAPKPVTLPQLLMDYMNIREAERSDWSPYGQQQGTLSDLKTVSEAIVFLKNKGLETLADLDSHLSDVKEKSTDIRSSMKTKERRMKEIGNLLSSLETFEALKPLHDEYMKIGWKRKKEKFAEAHSAELEKYNAALRYIKPRCTDGKYNKKALRAEYKTLEQECASMQTQITAVQSELKQLKDVRFYVSKALPEEKPVLGKEEKRSITQRLHENRERINQEQAQKKNKSRKRSDMEL